MQLNVRSGKIFSPNHGIRSLLVIQSNHFQDIEPEVTELVVEEDLEQVELAQHIDKIQELTQRKLDPIPTVSSVGFCQVVDRLVNSEKNENSCYYCAASILLFHHPRDILISLFHTSKLGTGRLTVVKVLSFHRPVKPCWTFTQTLYRGMVRLRLVLPVVTSSCSAPQISL